MQVMRDPNVLQGFVWPAEDVDVDDWSVTQDLLPFALHTAKWKTIRPLSGTLSSFSSSKYFCAGSFAREIDPLVDNLPELVAETSVYVGGAARAYFSKCGCGFDELKVDGRTWPLTLDKIAMVVMPLCNIRHWCGFPTACNVDVLLPGL